MKKLLLLPTLLLSLSGFAQAPTFNWAKSITGFSVNVIYAVTTDTAGNVYTTGTFGGTANIGPNDGNLAQVIIDATPNTNTARNVFVTKMTASGSLVWTKTFGGTYDDLGKAIKVDADGNVFVTGEFKGQVDFNPDAAQYFLNSGSVLSGNGTNSFIVKFGPTGNFLFAKAFVGTYNQEMNDLAIDALGNLYATGSYKGLNSFAVDFDPGIGTFFIPAQSDDVFIVKMENDGDFVWAKSFSGGTTASVNVEDRDKGNAIEVDSNGNVFVAGLFTETVDFDPSASVSTLTSSGLTDAFIVKLNPSGSLLWAKRIGSTGTDIGKSMGLDSSENAYLLGYYFEFTDEPLVDFNPNAGVANLVLANNIQNAVVKLNSAGDFVWAKRFRGNSTSNLDCTKAFDVDQNGNVFLLERFSGTVNTPVTYDFDEGAGVFNLTTSNNGVFVSKINSDGNFITAFRTGTDFNSVNPNAFCVSATGELYSAGKFDATTDFDPTSGVFSLNASGNSCFLQTMSHQTLGVAENTFSQLSLYPNPAQSDLHIQTKKVLEKASLKIISITGQTILEKDNLSGSNFSLDVSNLNQGIYILQFKNDKEVFNSKFIKR